MKLNFLLTKPFIIDLRTLALFRICLGFMVIIDLIQRAPDLVAFYTDQGVFPRKDLASYGLDWAFSLHAASGTATFQIFLFLTQASFALLLILGYRTRLVTSFIFILTLSLQLRNVYVLCLCDILLLLMLFWSLFLPLGARFSFDESLNKTPPQSNAFFSMATIALMIQVMCVYFFGALIKQTHPDWQIDRTAVLFAIKGGAAFGSELGQWLSQYQTITRGLTISVLNFEYLAPICLLLCGFFWRVRLILLFLFFMLHVGFLLFLRVGLFPFMSLTSLMVFLPGEVWDILTKRVRTLERLGIQIFYDESCEFCKKICLILRSFLMFPDTPILPAQKFPSVYNIMRQHNSWVVIDNKGREYIRYEALLVLIRHSPWFGWTSPLFSFKPCQLWGEKIYSWIEKNRAIVSEKMNGWLVFRKNSFKTRFTTNVFVSILLIIMITENINFTYGRETPLFIEKIIRNFNLYQRWTMFSFTIPERLWFVARGVTEEGKIADVYKNILNEPSNLPPTLRDSERWNPNYRWGMFVSNLWFNKNDHLRPYYLDYLCRKWNKSHQGQDRLAKIALFYYYGGGINSEKITVSLIHEYTCNQKQTKMLDPYL